MARSSDFGAVLGSCQAGMFRFSVDFALAEGLTKFHSARC